MKENQTPNVVIPTLKAYLQGEFSIGVDEQFSILKNARREENEIAEIASALGAEYIADLITFRPRRLAFFETIVNVQTEIRLENDLDLDLVVHNIYREYIVPLLKTRDTSGKKLEDKILEETEQEILAKVSSAFTDFEISEFGRNPAYQPQLTTDQQDILKEIKETYNIVKSRIDKGQYIPGEHSSTDDLNSITKKIVFDKFYNKKISYRIKELIQPCIMKLVERQFIVNPRTNKPLERLSHHTGISRHTFMITGAPGAGKGTALGMITIDAQVLGIEISDVAKCNADSYRNLLSSKKELGFNQVRHAGFNCDEVYLVTQRVHGRLKTKIQSPEGAPHILLDTVCITQEKINIGIMQGGQLHINCVSVPVEISLNRAFLRGRMTGRYVDTAYLLKANRDISRNFKCILIDNKHSSIDYVLMDNNVAKGDIPVLVAEIDLASKMIKIHDFNRLQQFINKENLNIKAKTIEDLSVTNTRESIIHYLDQLEQSGFNIVYMEEKVKKQLLHLKRNRKPAIREALEKKSNTAGNSLGSAVLNQRRCKKLLKSL